MATEVGVAFVRLLPSMRGFSQAASRALTSGLQGPSQSAGRTAGKELSDSITDAVTRSQSQFRRVAGRIGDTFSREMASAADDAGRALVDGLDGPAAAAGLDAGRELADGLVDGAEDARGRLRRISDRMADSFNRGFRAAGRDAGRDLSRGFDDGADSSRFRGIADRVGQVFSTAFLAIGVAAAGALTAGLSSALDRGDVTARLSAQLGGGEFGREMGELAGRLYTQGLGDSIGDTAEAVRRAWEAGIIPEDATDAQIERMTAQALRFSEVMGEDVGSTMEAIANLTRTGLATSFDEALNVLTRGIQQGGNRADDLLETFVEYSTQFDKLGLDAATATGLMVQGLQGGARDADQTADALKELGLRGVDLSETSRRAFGTLGLDADEMFERFAEGGPRAREALGEVLDGLEGLQGTSAFDNVVSDLFGGAGENLGDAILDLDVDTAAARLGDVEGAANDLTAAYDTAGQRIREFKRQALERLALFVGNVLIPGIERLVEVFGPPLRRAFEAVGPFISTFIESFTTLRAAFEEGESFGGGGIFDIMGTIGAAAHDAVEAIGRMLDALRPAFEFILNNRELLIGALAGVAAVVAAVLIPALIGLVAPLVVAVAPFLALAAAAAAIGAGILWLWNNVDGFRNFIQETLPQVAEIFRDVFTLVQEVVARAVEGLRLLWESHGEQIIEVARIAWDLISGIILGALDIIQGIIRTVTAVIRGDWSGAWEGIKQILSGVWQVIKAIVIAGGRLLVVVLKAAWERLKADARRLWDGIKDLVGRSLDDLVGFFRRFPGRVRGALGALAATISAPFRQAFNAVRRLWNSTVGGFRVSIPGFLGFGGVDFSIPRMHTGGIVPGVGDVPIIAQGGEGVFTRDQMAALGSGAMTTAQASPVIVRIEPDGLDRSLLEWLRKSVRVEGGGDVQMAFGAHALL